MLDSAHRRLPAGLTAMVDSPAMPVPVAVVDVLNSLLEAERNSLFRFMGEGSPYLGAAGADVRRPLAEMVEANARHVAELAAAIERLGGYPTEAGGGVQAEEQYLAFLSLKFLLPKLADSKQLTIRRYDNAIRTLEKLGSPPHVPQLLKRQQSEHKAHLDVLNRKAQDVIAASR